LKENLKDRVNNFIANRGRIERKFNSLYPEEDQIFFTTGNFIDRIKEDRLDPTKHGNPWHYNGGIIITGNGLFFYNPIFSVLPLIMGTLLLMMVAMEITLFVLSLFLITMGLFGLIFIPFLIIMMVLFGYIGYLISFQMYPRIHFLRFDDMTTFEIEYKEETGRHFDLFTMRTNGKLNQIISFNEMPVRVKRFLNAVKDLKSLTIE
jgi:hypothetical protein